jgi:hypothetical protein
LPFGFFEPEYLDNPRQIRDVRHALMRASAETFWRFEMYYAGYPWRLWALHAMGLDRNVREAIAQNILDDPMCCKDPAFTQKVEQLFPTVEAMLSREACEVLMASMGSLTLHTAHTERTHAVHRRFCNPTSNGVRSLSVLSRFHVVRSHCDGHRASCIQSSMDTTKNKGGSAP